MHPRGIYELRDLGKEEMRSVDADDFATEMQMLHEHVKGQLHDSNQRYKQREDLKRREVNFEVRDQVLAHLKRERLPRKEYIRN